MLCILSVCKKIPTFIDNIVVRFNVRSVACFFVYKTSHDMQSISELCILVCIYTEYMCVCTNNANTQAFHQCNHRYGECIYSTTCKK